MNTCLTCGKRLVRHGKDRKGQQRWRCQSCKVTTIHVPKMKHRGRLSEHKELKIATMLDQEASVREIVQKVGVTRGTVCSRRAKLRMDIHEPTNAFSKNHCHYCGQRIIKERRYRRQTPTMKHQFCDSKCYQCYLLATDASRLANHLERIVKYA